MAGYVAIVEVCGFNGSSDQLFVQAETLAASGLLAALDQATLDASTPSSLAEDCPVLYDGISLAPAVSGVYHDGAFAYPRRIKPMESDDGGEAPASSESSAIDKMGQKAEALVKWILNRAHPSG